MKHPTLLLTEQENQEIIDTCYSVLMKCIKNDDQSLSEFGKERKQRIQGIILKARKSKQQFQKLKTA